MRIQKAFILTLLAWAIFSALGDSRGAESPSITKQSEWTGRPDYYGGISTVAGKHLYYSQSFPSSTTGKTTIFDIGGEGRPPVVGEITFPGGNASFNVFFGHYAYGHFLRENQWSIAVFYLENKSQPVLVREIPNPLTNPFGEKSTMVVSGDWLYLGNSKEFAIVSLSNPTMPILVGRLPVAANSIAVANGLAYVAANNGQLNIIDITNPSSPSVVGVISEANRTKGIFITDSYLHVYSDYFRVYDLSNPISPRQIFKSKNSMENWTLSPPSGGIVIMFWRFGAKVFDISIPGSPIELGDATLGNIDLERLKAADSRIFFSETSGIDGRYYGISKIDFSDPLKPRQTQLFSLTQNIAKFDVAGNRAIAQIRADAGADFLVFDVSNPKTPLMTSFQPRSWATNGFRAFGDQIFAKTTNGFDIYTFNVSPNQFGFSGSYTSVDSGLPIEKIGDFLFVKSDNRTDLAVVKILESGNAVKVTNYTSGHFNFGLADAKALGNYLYVSWETSLDVFDASDPQNLKLLKSHSVGFGGAPITFALDDSGIIALSPNAPATAYRFVDPVNIQRIGSTAWDVGAFYGAGQRRIYKGFKDSSWKLDMFSTADLNSTNPLVRVTPTAAIKIIAKGEYVYTTSANGFAIWKTVLPPPPEPPKGPKLEIAFNHPSLVLRWPDSSSGYNLYAQAEFRSDWQLVTINPARQGGYFIYTNRFPFADALFYTLRK